MKTKKLSFTENVLLVSTIVLFVLTETISPLVFGINSVKTFRFALLVFYLGITGLHIKATSRHELSLVFVGFIAIIFWLFRDVQNSIMINTLLFILPAVISLAYSDISIRMAKAIRIFIYIFFIFECLFAIYEKSIGYAFYPQPEDIDEWQLMMTRATEENSYSFRSTSLFGNPLTNALIVMTMYPFLLFDLKEFKYRMALSLLTLLALSSFNARAATIIFFVVFATNYYYNELKKSKKYVDLKIIFFFSLFIATFTFFANSSFGGRLFNQDKLLEGSAKTRLDFLSIIGEVDLSTILIGNPTNQALFTENGLFNFIFLYGIVLTLTYLIIYFGLLKKYLHQYSLLNICLIALSSFGLSMTNPSFFSSNFVIILLICVHVFSKTK